MIAFASHRPALQIGRHQVLDYGTTWLDDAIRRAATAADQEDFPFVSEVRSGIIQYLEHQCPLRLMPLHELFARVRSMLVKIGCERIAAQLRPLAPPVTLSLAHAAAQAGNAFELAFFETLRHELGELRQAGAEEIRFTGLRESARILCGRPQWDKRCEKMLGEIEAFLRAWEREQTAGRPLHLQMEGSDR